MDTDGNGWNLTLLLPVIQVGYGAFVPPTLSSAVRGPSSHMSGRFLSHDMPVHSFLNWRLWLPPCHAGLLVHITPPVNKRFTVLVVTVDPDHHEGLVLLLHSGLWVQRSMFEFREFIEFVQTSGSEINKKVFLQGQIVNIFNFAETWSLLQLLSSTQ